MKLRNRQRLLALARLLDRCASKLRRIAKDGTPKRGPRKPKPSNTGGGAA